MTIEQIIPLSMATAESRLSSIMTLQTSTNTKLDLMNTKLDTLISLYSNMNSANTPYSYRFISGAATTQVLTGAGVLYSVIVGRGVNNNGVAIYDNTSGTSNPIAYIYPESTALVAPDSNCITFGDNGINIATGIRVVTTHTDQRITVIFK